MTSGGELKIDHRRTTTELIYKDRPGRLAKQLQFFFNAIYTISNELGNLFVPPFVSIKSATQER